MTEPKKTVKQSFVEELKKEGLDIAEDAIAGLFKASIKTGQKWMMNHKNTYVKMFAPMLGLIEAPILAEIDKIDGEDDADR